MGLVLVGSSQVALATGQTDSVACIKLAYAMAIVASHVPGINVFHACDHKRTSKGAGGGCSP